MKVLDIKTFGGPNIWSLSPVIKMKLDLEELEERPSNKIEGFTDRLLTLIPTLQSHRCSIGEPGGLIQRMMDGTWMGHIIEHIALELQCLSGTEVGYGKTLGTDQYGVYNVIYSYTGEKVGIAAGNIAVKVIEHLVYGKPLDLAEELDYLAHLVDRLSYGPSTQGLIDEAHRRDIPVIRLNDGNLVQLGYGVYQKRIQATVTSYTNLISVDIASDKNLTKQLLSDIGIPVPKGRVAEEWEDVQDAIREFGYPVVIKPLDGHHGKGVAVGVKDEATARRAFDQTREFSDKAIVEMHVEGKDHRILVVNGEVVAASQRVPAHVTGDGEHTVKELVEITNRNPLRGVGHEKPLSRITIDAESHRLLQDQNLNLNSVPIPGREVWLKYTANLSSGGTAIDCTDDLNMSTRDMAVRAAKAIGLDIAGVDFITTDIHKRPDETKGAVCEVNAGPGFRMHLHPSEGIARNVASPVMDMLFPPGTPTRIPVVAITGTNGKTTTARMLSHILKMGGKKVGLTSTDGIFIDGRRILTGDLTGPWSARVILKDPTVDFAVLETARGGILRAGLGFDQCDVGAVINVEEDHLGLGEVETLEELAYVKSLVLEVVKKNGFSLVNAEDERILNLRHRFRGHQFYFSMDPQNEPLRKQIQDGGHAIYLQDEIIKIVIRKYEIPVMRIHSIPATFHGKARFNILNSMIAIAAAYSSGIKLDDIRGGMKTFDTNFYLSPGRLNLESVKDFSVLLDYGHNPPALRAMSDFIRQMKPNRTIGLIAAPGDRREIDFENIGKIAAQTFDAIIIKEDVNLRGRMRGETARILYQYTLSFGKKEVDVRMILDEKEAVDCALRNAAKDDLIVIFCDNIREVHRQVVKFKES
jgi:cyanophycin synthetase